MSSDTRKRPPLIPVIISGGSGTRLWPLSREARPKQFLPLLGEKSLFQETLLRAQRLENVEAPIVVCNVAHRELVVAQCREVGVEPAAIVLEPVGRNTAPAVAVAALVASGRAAGVDPLLLVLPADHVIADGDAFARAVRVAVEAALSGRLVTFGVVPDRPETGYGYIERGVARGAWAEIAKFVEKPDRATAERYLASGRYLWNSGMFLFSAARALRELAAHASGILARCERVATAARVEGPVVLLGNEFAQCPADSVDYAVMEKTADGAVVPLRAGWSDMGSWAALHDVLEKDARGNVARGDAFLEQCRDSYVLASSRVVAAVGLEGVVVVETPDAVLVMTREAAQSVKLVVDRLNERK